MRRLRKQRARSAGRCELCGKDMGDLANSNRQVCRFSTLIPAQSRRDLLSADEGIDATINGCKKTAVTRVYIEGGWR